MSRCGPGQQYSQGFCWPQCKDNFTGSGPTCAQNCPTNGRFLNLGPLCQKVPQYRPAGLVPYVTPCPEGYIDNGRDCIQQQVCQWPNQCVGQGVPTILLKERQVCPRPNMDLENGLCFERCPSGYIGFGNQCLPECPPGFFDTQPGRGLHCIKPTYGRGAGLTPLYSPLSTIGKSPNGSTLLERYRVGQTVQEVQQINRNLTDLTGAAPGDPKKNLGTPQNLIQSTMGGIGSSVKGLVGDWTDDAWKWFVGFLVTVILIFIGPVLIGPIVQTFTVAGTSLIIGAGKLASAATEAGGQVISSVEKAASNVAASTIESTESLVQRSLDASANFKLQSAISAKERAEAIKRLQNIQNLANL